MGKTLVLKFGGAALKDIAHFENVAAIIEAESKSYERVCVVVSAMAGMTDYLGSLADLVHMRPPGREKDMLLSVGERVSMSLLAMLLQKKGVKAESFTGSQAGIITTTEHSNAKIIDVKPKRLAAVFESNKIPIIAGFQGVSLDGEITTLGRGGSDTTAVAIAVALGAEKVMFFKDVDGVCSQDPKKFDDVSLLDRLTYEEALKVIGEEKGAVLHPRSVRLAWKNNLVMQVLSFQENSKVKSGSMVFSGEKGAQPAEKCYEDVEMYAKDII
ncbi:MAG: Aspartokinase [Chlamydiia bacterium]|nr:Aspartokinase [Chlamydiia bacterium]MCH9618700.1 Aspartokinase [Chlamydiia bacterium]MCH9624380.1 Aspartokinase [Chlamydiia bacterium]